MVLVLIGVDTETELFPPTGTDKVNLRVPCPPLVCTTWAVLKDEPNMLAHTGLFMHDESLEVFFNVPDPERKYAFCNPAFDLGVLSKAYPALRERLQWLVNQGRILDVRAMYLLREPDPPSKRASLQQIAKQILGETLEKGGVRTSFRRGMVLSKEQRDYAILDADVTVRIAAKLQQMPYGSIDSYTHKHWNHEPRPHVNIAAELISGIEEPDVVFSRAAANMAWHLVPRGMHIDPIALAKANDELRLKAEGLRGELVTADLATSRREPGSGVTDITDYAAGKLTAQVITRSWMRAEKCAEPTVIRFWTGKAQTAPAKVSVRLKELREIAEKWCIKAKVPIPVSKKTGGTSLARDHWTDHLGSLPDSLELYFKYVRANKIYTAFTKPLVEAHATHVFPGYFVPGAVTGRWACSKPNLQQVYIALRHIYVPEEGHVFVQADYPTLELYTLCQCMIQMGIRGPLLEALKIACSTGPDIHTATALQMKQSDPRKARIINSDERQAAKEANFGLPGGMGVKRLQNTVTGKAQGWSFGDAKRVRDGYFGIYSDVDLYLRQFKINAYGLCPTGNVREWIRRLGFDPTDSWPSSFDLLRKINDGHVFDVTLPSGRMIPERGYAAGANCFFQGLGADVMTRAFNKACEAGLPMCCVVHDNMVLEVPGATGEGDPEVFPSGMTEPTRLGHQLTAIMSEALRYYCPDVPEPEIDFEVLERWK